MEGLLKEDIYVTIQKKEVKDLKVKLEYNGPIKAPIKEQAKVRTSDISGLRERNEFNIDQSQAAIVPNIAAECEERRDKLARMDASFQESLQEAKAKKAEQDKMKAKQEEESKNQPKSMTIEGAAFDAAVSKANLGFQEFISTQRDRINASKARAPKIQPPP